MNTEAMPIPAPWGNSAWARWLTRVERAWPAHGSFLRGVAQGTTPAARETAARNAELIERLAGDDATGLIDGYRWMCEMVLAEELDFRREGRYRHSTFEQAAAAVYSNRPVMERYMSGLLLSQVLWPNHIATFDFYARHYLSRVMNGTRHLEIGPGHGLLLFHAAERRPAEAVGWDISPTSLAHARSCLERLGCATPVLVEQRDLFAPLDGADEQRFDSVVMSELLEHLEAPGRALAAARRLLSRGGSLFVNAPVNSPALDHIFLFRSPEELIALVEEAGFSIEESQVAPASGYSEARARRQGLPMSVAIIARA